MNFVSGWSRHAKTNKLEPHLILSENCDEGLVMMLLCKISCSFSTKCSCYQVELLVFSTPTLSSRGLCWGTMSFLHLVGAMFYQTHGNSQSITFSFFSHSSCFLTLSFFSLLFLLKYSQTSVFLAFSVHPPLSSPLPPLL